MPRFTTLSAVVLACLALPAAAHASWTWPLRGEVITHYQNGEDPYAADQHRGVDIAGAIGTPVLAAAGGEVRFAGVAGSSGLTVSVRTDDGFDTSYLHLSSASARAGERVAAGERLGAVGTSGTRSAVEPHLHFGVREAGTRHAYRDPLDFLPAPRTPPAARPVPAPEPVPVAPVPPALPEPVRSAAPAPIGSPRRAPGGGRVPAGGRLRSPAGGRLRSPAPRRIRAGGGVPGPAARRAPAPAPGRVHPLARRPGSEPSHVRVEATRRAAGADTVAARREGPIARLAPGPTAEPRPAVQTAAPPGSPAGVGRAGDGEAARPGPDLGMVLACVGLLTAAALLGFTDGGRAAAGRGATGLSRALRPLLGSR